MNLELSIIDTPLQTKGVGKTESQSEEWASCEKEFFKSAVAPKQMSNQETLDQNSRLTSNDQIKDDIGIRDMETKDNSKSSFRSQPDKNVRTFKSIQMPESETNITSNIQKSKEPVEGNYLTFLLSMYAVLVFQQCVYPFTG